MSTLQQGTLFLEQTVEGATMKSPLPEVTLYFLQNGVEKTNTVTNKEGKFSITLPVGAYSITAEKVGGYNGKIPLAAGQTIQLTRNSPKNAVEKFITAAIGADVDHELIKQIQDIAKQAEQSAKDAKDAANSIPKVIPVNKGGTGATTAAKARENLGFENAEYLVGMPPNRWNGHDWEADPLLTFKEGLTIFYGASTVNNPTRRDGIGLVIRWSNWGMMWKLGNGNRVAFSSIDTKPGNKNEWCELYHTGNLHTLGIGSTSYDSPTSVSRNFNSIQEGGLYNFANNTKNSPNEGRWWSLLNFPDAKAQIAIRTSGFDNQELWLRTKTGGSGNERDEWAQAYLTNNTAVDSNGFIKAASPVLKLFDDRIEHNDQFIGEPRFRKLETGVYEVTNTLGLAKEGWTIETPKDRHGRPYFHVIVQESHGRVVLSVHDEYEVRKTETIRDIYGEEQEVEVVEKTLGEARDIKPHERWIDLRFHEEPEEPIDEDEEWMKYLTPEELEEMNNPSVES